MDSQTKKEWKDHIEKTAIAFKTMTNYNNWGRCNISKKKMDGNKERIYLLKKLLSK